MVLVLFEGEGGKGGDEGRVQPCVVVWLGVCLCHVEAQLVYGGSAASLAAEENPCVEVKCKDKNQDH